MTDNPWRKLAEKTGPCQTCDGTGNPRTIPTGRVGIPHVRCPTCHGTGRVPLIPGLRQPCLYCRGTGTCYRTRFGPQLAPRYPKDEDAYPCPNCGSTGWLLVDEDRAIVAAQEYILSRGQFWGFEVDHGIYGITMLIWDGGKLVSESDPQLTYAAGLAQALERALGEKHG